MQSVAIDGGLSRQLSEEVVTGTQGEAGAAGMIGSPSNPPSERAVLETQGEPAACGRTEAEGAKAAGAADTVEGLKAALMIDTEKVKSHLDEVVRSTVQETLNQLLDAEADRVAGAGRYERSEGRKDTRAGSYQRQLQTKAGQVTLTVPRLRKLPLETAIIERYKRRESSVEEALIEMYLAGVSMRRVEDITEALWGTRVSASAVSDMAQKVYGKIDQWRTRPLTGEYAYVYLDGIWLKRSWGGEVKNVAVLIAIGVDAEGYREVLGVAEGTKEDAESWRTFLRHLKERGLGAQQWGREASMATKNGVNGTGESGIGGGEEIQRLSLLVADASCLQNAPERVRVPHVGTDHLRHLTHDLLKAIPGRVLDLLNENDRPWVPLDPVRNRCDVERRL